MPESGKSQPSIELLADNDSIKLNPLFLQHGQSFLARQRQTIGNSSSTPNNARSAGSGNSGGNGQQPTPSNFIDY